MKVKEFKIHNKDGSVLICNPGLALCVSLKRIDRGIKNDFGDRTREAIPKHKMFDFLRKAFDESPYKPGMKFKFVGYPDLIGIVKELKWLHNHTGYVLMMTFQFEDEDKIAGSLCIKNINSLTANEAVWNNSIIEIIE